ncbi:hypothetical protein SUDANB1_07109 [Streptomyces sp. enrichment culture]
MTVLAAVILVAPIFLILAGEKVSARIRARKEGQ